MRRVSSILAAVAVCLPSAAFAATYQVGPSRQYTQLTDVEAILQPGDVVEVDGGATYSGDIHIRPQSAGTETQKITIRGMPVNGQRPVISGGSQFGIVLHGNHTIFENFEVTGSSGACIINKAHDLTLRNLYVHDCPGQGILGTDSDAGDQTIEFSEIARTGGGIYDHQIYLANDQTLYPNARMRIQHNYIHDGLGGNNVKSRASRNEIYYNWIEAPYYHILDLIGADGQDPSLAREDSDVVGNVLIQTSQYTIARIGGDGTGNSDGRYRFAYNTIVTSASQGDLFRANAGIESIAIHDNVFVMPDGGSPNFLDSGDAEWTTGSPQIAAERNFVQQGMSAPSFFTSTVSAPDAMFTDFANGNFTPATGSPLIDAGAAGSGPSGYEIPNPLAVPGFVPPARSVGTEALVRPVVGTPDLGAYEFGTQVDPGPGTGGGSGTGGGDTGGSGTGGNGSGGTGSGSGGNAGGGGSSDDDGSGVGAGRPGSGGSGGSDSDGSGLDDDGGGGGSTGGGCSATGAAAPGMVSSALVGLAALAAGLRRRRTARK